MFGFKLLGSGPKYFAKVRDETMALIQSEPKAAAPPKARDANTYPVSGVKKLKFFNVKEACAEIDRLEAELAKRTTPTAMPPKATPTKPTPRTPAATLPTWRECESNLATARNTLTTRLNAISGCNFAGEVAERLGLTNATSPAAQGALVGALLTACWFAGDAETSTTAPAVETLESVRAAMEKERDPVKKGALAKKARELRGDGHMFKSLLIAGLLLVAGDGMAQGFSRSRFDYATPYSGGTNKATALSTNAYFVIPVPRSDNVALFCDFKFLNAPGAGDATTITIDFFRGFDGPAYETNIWQSWVVPGNSTTPASQMTNLVVAHVPYLRGRIRNFSTNSHATNITVAYSYKN
jgi:hypothetical protein